MDDSLLFYIFDGLGVLTMTKKMFYFIFPLSCLVESGMYSMDSDSFRPPSFSPPLYSSPSPDSTRGHFEEIKVITSDLIRACLTKLEGIDRHYWWYLSEEIADELNRKPWLLYYRENKLPIIISYDPSQIKKLEKDLNQIKNSNQWQLDRLKKDFATVVAKIYATIVCNGKTTTGLRLRVEDLLRKELKRERLF